MCKPNRRSEVRLKVLALLAGALVASVAAVGVADAASIFGQAPTKLTARVLPKHINPTSIKKAKYKYTARGTLTYPSKYCPNGATVYPYCEDLTHAVCTGKVTWYAKLGKNPAIKKSNKKVGSGSTSLTGKCTYVFSHRFPTSDFIAKHKAPGRANRHVGVEFFITFKGNTYLKGSSARRQVVVAKVLEP